MILLVGYPGQSDRVLGALFLLRQYSFLYSKHQMRTTVSFDVNDMIQNSVWAGIDRSAFFENAILLELKHRSQGDHVKMQMANASARDNPKPSPVYPYEVRDLLDDISLVASGSGGAHNVSAACLEVADDEQRLIVIRMASNAGMNEEILQDIRQILDEIIEACANGQLVSYGTCGAMLTYPGFSDDDIQNLTLSRIVRRCKSRLKKHILVLHRILLPVRTPVKNELRSFPLCVTKERQTQADSSESGAHQEKSSHPVSVEEQHKRLVEIRAVIAKAAGAFADTSIEELQSLLYLAYQACKSSMFQQYIDRHVHSMANSKVYVSISGEVTERLGQLSKFARAATSIVKHIRRMSHAGITIRVEAVPSLNIQVSELSKTTPGKLRRQGGKRCSRLGDVQLEGMIKRWPSYREHAEIQLLMFYEENTAATLHTNYIGCSKQSCFLCFHFIVQHGRFHVSGCHQSLYSLWSVRDYMQTEDFEAVTKVRQSLAHLADMLYGKVVILRDLSQKYDKGGNGKESIANLSRASVALTDVSARGVLPNTSGPILQTSPTLSSGSATVIAEERVPLSDRRKLRANTPPVRGLQGKTKIHKHRKHRAHLRVSGTPNHKLGRFDYEHKRLQRVHQRKRSHQVNDLRHVGHISFRRRRRARRLDCQEREQRSKHAINEKDVSALTRSIRKVTVFMLKLLFGRAYNAETKQWSLGQGYSQ